MRRVALFLFLAAAIVPLASAHATQVKEVVSSKGFKAWLVEEHGLPLVAVNVSFTGAGFAYDPKDKQGRANLTAALLMEGAGDMGQREFSEALEARAIRMNTNVDADTLDISFESLSEHKELAFSYMALALTKPRFDDSAFLRAHSQAQSILTQQQQQPAYQLDRAFKKAAYGDHPYANEQVGTKETLDDLRVSDIRNVAEHYLSKENIVIAAVGDITAEELSALMDKYLAVLPEKYAPDSKVEDVIVAAGEDPVIIDFDIPQTMVFFGTQGVKRSDPNYFAAYVMNEILGGSSSLTSILGEEIRESRGLAYSVSSHIEPLSHAAMWRGNFASRNDQARSAVNVLLATLKAFREKGPTDEEVQNAKQYLVNSFVLNLDSNDAIASFLINMQINHLGIDYLQRRNSMVMSVRKEEIMDMTNRLIDPDKMLLFMIGRPVLAQPKS